MRNEFFQAENARQKRLKMYQIIRHRLKDLDREHLNAILDALDYDRQYFVKIMRNPQKFKNIVVNEVIKEVSENVHSESYRIYGDFICGLYKRTESELMSNPSHLDEQKPAAALKYTKLTRNGIVRSIHEIVIYQPECIKAN